MLPEPLIHNVSLTNPRIVILERAQPIREVQIHCCNNLILHCIQVVKTSLFGHITAL